MIKLLLLLFLTSCSQYVQNIHKQIDREEKISKRSDADQRLEGFSSQFKKSRNPFNRSKDKRPIKNPITYSLGSGPSGQLNNSSKRPRRLNAEDFRDEEENSSLWANQGSSSSLFTYQNEKHAGDIVIINVLENLRNQISSELKRNFPDKNKSTESSSGKNEGKAAGTPASGATPTDDMDMKIYDKVSGTVMEEINKDYLLLRGRKDIIFKKEKKSIEIQALVPRKDIMENDYVNSDKLLESRVYILKDF